MKKVLIVAPHFPPSNLAGVHRSRLLSLHLQEFGWEPVLLTVHHDHYEENLDWRLTRLVPVALRIERVGAIPTKPIRLVGDIGIRGFLPMLKRILHNAQSERADFIYITIPSNYAALLGRPARFLTGIPYGIDYIDPWVTPLEPLEKIGVKAWLSNWLARLLEPVAVRHVSLITGVAERYYDGVLERNPQLLDKAVLAAMPYGAAPTDHDAARKLALAPYLFSGQPAAMRLCYAGAMLPRAFGPLETILQAISEKSKSCEGVKFEFIGTGKRPDDPEGFNIRPLAEKYGLWGTVVREHPARIPYLDVLTHLEASDAIFILGSTEPHYTPSKVFQAVLSRRPVFAVLHEASTAVSIIRESGAGIVLTFNGDHDLSTIREGFLPAFQEFRKFCETFDPLKVNMDGFEAYSARNMAKVLAKALDQALERVNGN
ncbi:MAG: hypothetical protein P4L43_10515 [Syntrophobacteraceae bacterium]|nr:hypothetical protein [Syntrophobacteraceae bacterium]